MKFLYFRFLKTFSREIRDGNIMPFVKYYSKIMEKMHATTWNRLAT